MLLPIFKVEFSVKDYGKLVRPVSLPFVLLRPFWLSV
jgi:hypothetical protein